MPGHAFIEDRELRARHRREIYPHGYEACGCGAGEGIRCRHRSIENKPLKNAHRGRRFRLGFGFDEWKEREMK